MEIMALPSREELLFTKHIYFWITGDEIVNGKKKFIFHKDTPEDILNLYNDIKDKLEFAY